MKGRIDAADRISRRMPALKKTFGIRKMGVFGSCARGEQKEGSDMDLLVELDQTPSLLEFIALERALSKIAGRKVDLVMKSALKPAIGKRIMKEVRYI